MSRSELVKIGVPPGQAQGMRQLRRIRQILEQHDAAIARLDAATQERIREVVTADIADGASEEPVTATA